MFFTACFQVHSDTDGAPYWDVQPGTDQETLNTQPVWIVASQFQCSHSEEFQKEWKTKHSIFSCQSKILNGRLYSPPQWLTWWLEKKYVSPLKKIYVLGLPSPNPGSGASLLNNVTRQVKSNKNLPNIKSQIWIEISQLDQKQENIVFKGSKQDR